MWWSPYVNNGLEKKAKSCDSVKNVWPVISYDGHHVWTMTWKEKVKNCYSVFVADWYTVCLTYKFVTLISQKHC